MNVKAKVTTVAWMATSIVMTAGWPVGNAAERQSTSVTASTEVWKVANIRTAYADGTYTATGQYGNAPSFITVTVTLHAGLITSANIKTHATNPISLDYQRRFADAVPAVVVGKPIEQVKVDRLAGSSGTPEGFNAALEQIKKQAAKSG
ncbi:hypothetical protein [Sodalis sp. RH23]|uniref:hypothetical protein n=1 Tax=unclassified Sodalis (in: enterobacteria) TaxID=2636512 RepID=UPI0039B52EE1